ncbi:putative Zn-dependent protease [Rhizobium lusitanum]|uniref:Putative Zn-dependent protease n=1 Tax=Rhizobium lusitanum TaxID=293958 RepID=A0A7X0MG88_9HYPH|nr:putative Zn-dependent protease [Rhizobium lusitanum]
MRYPHPCRITMFHAISSTRMNAVRNTWADALANSTLRQSRRQEQAIQGWALSREMAAVNEIEQADRF